MGLLPPVWSNGSLLVDGGYTNNMPIDIMQGLAPGMSRVVAVDVENKDTSGMQNIQNYGDSLSGWWLLWRHILAILRLSKPLKIPGSYDITLSMSYIAHTMSLRGLLKQGRRNDSICYIQPPGVQGYKLLDYHKFDEIVELGVRGGRSAVQAWLRRAQRHEQARLDAERRVVEEEREAVHRRVGAASAGDTRAIVTRLGSPVPGRGSRSHSLTDGSGLGGLEEGSAKDGREETDSEGEEEAEAEALVTRRSKLGWSSSLLDLHTMANHAAFPHAGSATAGLTNSATFVIGSRKRGTASQRVQHSDVLRSPAGSYDGEDSEGSASDEDHQGEVPPLQH